VYYCIWCSALVVLAEGGCGCVELRRKQCALCEGYYSFNFLSEIFPLRFINIFM